MLSLANRLVPVIPAILAPLLIATSVSPAVAPRQANVATGQSMTRHRIRASFLHKRARRR
jgi:hypothetical protein